jgi:iron complex transport system substrate-binding protein
MKRFTPILMLFLALTLALPACAPAATPALTSSPTLEPAPDQGITLTDGLGRTVSLDEPAQTVVSLAASNTEILFALGAGAQVIGRDDFSDYPAEAAEITSVGGSMSDYNLEEITRLSPDLVLASGLNTPEQVKAIEDLGLTVYYLPNPVKLEELYANLETVGMLTGREQEVADLAESLKQRVDAVETALADVEDSPLVFYELDATDPAKPWTSGPGTFLDTFIRDAGGKNVAAEMDSAWAQISQEELILQNPDIILLGDAAYGVTPEQVAARPGWDQIKAVQEGQIFPFDDNLASRPGPRLVDGLENLAKILHPDLFEQAP